MVLLIELGLSARLAQMDGNGLMELRIGELTLELVLELAAL